MFQDSFPPTLYMHLENAHILDPILLLPVLLPVPGVALPPHAHPAQSTWLVVWYSHSKCIIRFYGNCAGAYEHRVVHYHYLGTGDTPEGDGVRVWRRMQSTTLQSIIVLFSGSLIGRFSLVNIPYTEVLNLASNATI